MNRRELVEKINSLDVLSSEEKAALVDLLKQKKYGLVWEDKPEDVEERLRAELPVLREVKDKAILSPLQLEGSGEAPNHILIEGDNLEALTALTYTHENSIDVIYIDPPYNTGNKDFVYNDSFVDSEDGYRHSKWLSFMNKRLRIAKRLLSDKGVIFISIDDNEQANLKLLCDEVFGSRNFLMQISWRRSDNQSNIGKVAKVAEYIILYCKSWEFCKLGRLPLTEKAKAEYRYNDENGLFRRKILLDKTRGRHYYEVKTKKNTFLNGPWMITEDVFRKMDSNGEIYWTTEGDGQPYGKIYLANTKGQIPNNFWGIEFGTNQRGSIELEAILGKRIFDFPKPESLIQYIVGLGEEKDALVLDFFAGSGTTLHATMQLNAEDGGHRQCILVTNNENNICEEVTYERNKRVINGYTTPKGEQVEGLHNNNLRYYQIDHVEREASLTAKRKLMNASAELLCIKHDIYEEQTTFGSLTLKPHIARFFAEDTSTGSAQAKQMLIIYKVEAIERLVEEIQKMPEDTNIMVYVFSTNNYAMDADFEDVADKVTLCALPAAIYNAYQKVLPKKKTPQAPLKGGMSEIPDSTKQETEEDGE